VIIGKLISDVAITVLLTLHTSQRLQEEIHAQARRDTLTDAYNRRAFIEFSGKEWLRSVRYDYPLSILSVDIDHFKIFNDFYGHLSGDQALIRIAEVIKSAIKRPGDLAARYGGEEFVVMLMNTTAAEAADIAEEIRSRVEQLGMGNEKVQSVITVSLGVSSAVPHDNMTNEELIASADRALYRAKECGRNKVIVWTDNL